MIGSKELKILIKLQQKGFSYIGKDIDNSTYAYEVEPIKTDSGYTNESCTNWEQLESKYFDFIPANSYIKILDFIDTKVVDDFQDLESNYIVTGRALINICKDISKDIICLYKETDDCEMNYECYHCIMKTELEQAEKEILKELKRK